MRITLVAALAFGVLGCSSSEKPKKLRFVFDVEASLVDDLAISIGGQSVTVRPPVPNVRTTSGFVDFEPGAMKPDAQPEIRLRSACGDRLLTAAEMERKPPNESNVVVITLTKRLMPESTFTVAVDPNARNVKIGSFEVPAQHPELMKFYGGCAFTVSVDGQTTQMRAPTATDHSLLVAASPSACLTEGVVVYATPGARCAREWSEKRTGELAYWGRTHPSYAFRSIPTSKKTHSQTCIERGFFGRCGG